jgi:hypothetical protein
MSPGLSAALGFSTLGTSSGAELGPQPALIHVETPNFGKIHACSAIHATMRPIKKRSSIEFAPVVLVMSRTGR